MLFSFSTCLGRSKKSEKRPYALGVCGGGHKPRMSYVFGQMPMAWGCEVCPWTPEVVFTMWGRNLEVVVLGQYSVCRGYEGET